VDNYSERTFSFGGSSEWIKVVGELLLAIRPRFSFEFSAFICSVLGFLLFFMHIKVLYCLSYLVERVVFKITFSRKSDMRPVL